MKAIKRYLQARRERRRQAVLNGPMFVILYYADENAPSQFVTLITTHPKKWKRGNWKEVHNYGYGNLRYLLEDDDSAYYEALEWTLE